MDGDETVALGARALNLLIALTSHAAEVVTKEQLIAVVWPGIFVDDNNLRVHMSALRRALRDGQDGNRYIVNIPGRGYSFVAPIQAVGVQIEEPAAATEPSWVARLPVATSRIFGRAAVVDTLCAQLPQRRFITLVGPGGIGKTTVAVAVARSMASSYRDGVCFVDLSAIRDPALVPGAILSALGQSISSPDAVVTLIAYVARMKMLLVLDNCEHVIEIAAITAEKVSDGAPDMHVLCTSREPLRAAGERLYRLRPLEAPPGDASLTAAQALTFPCIQLFVERAAAVQDSFTFSDADAPVVAELCQRLDGIALAIELAAGRVAAFGLRELAARLDDRFRLLTSGRRTALPRHQTLTATLDWSYELLPASEQVLLRHLSVFAGEFSLNAAVAVVEQFEATTVLDDIAGLVSKSLVAAEQRSGGMRYRLLETTRIYCGEKLRLAGELASARRAHAAYMCDIFANAETDAARLPTEQWMENYASQLDNVRAALDWAAANEGDTAILVALTISAVPLWVQLSLMAECRACAQTALDAVRGDGDGAARCRMQLYAALGWSMMYASARTSEVGSTWAATLDLANRLGDAGYRLRAIWGVWISKLNSGDLDTALELAQQLIDLVEDLPNQTDRMMADRLMATTLHFRGNQDEARRFIERMFTRYARAGPQPRIAQFHVDQQVTARYFQARILWLQGYVDQAMEAVERNIQEGEALGHALAFGSVLGQAACPIALFTGDFPAARRYAAALLHHAEKHGLHLWRVWAQCFDGLVRIKQGDEEHGLDAMRAALDAAGDAGFLPRYMVLRAECAMALGRAGDLGPALETIDDMLQRCELSRERWYVPELMRLRGEVLILTGSEAAAEAAATSFEAAARLGGEQGARSWQLRAATSLARLRHGSARAESARLLLATIFATFSEGLTTSDLLMAEQVLKSP